MKPFELAWLNLARRKTSTCIALIAIACSVGLAGTLLRLFELSDARFSTIAEGGEVVIGAKAGGIDILLGSLNLEGAYPGYLPLKLFQSLRAQTQVKFEDGAEAKPDQIESIIPFLYFAKWHDYRVIGTDRAFLDRPRGLSLTLSEGNWAANDGEVIVGADVAARENLHLENELIANIWHDGETAETQAPIRLKVSGILQKTDSAWDRGMYSSFTFAQAALRTQNLSLQSVWGAEVLNYFLVFTKGAGIDPLRKLVDERTVGQLISVEGQKRKLSELTGSGREMALLVTVMLILLGALSVIGIMMTRFDSMTVHISVLRALGYRTTAIAAWLMWEGLLLGFLACVIGAAIDAFLFPIARAMMGSALPANDVVNIALYHSAVVWCAAILSTLLATLTPLIRIYRQDVHTALKGV